MKPNETLRFRCCDCHVVFDISASSSREWRGEEDEPELADIGQPTVCPWCGAGELKLAQGQPIRVSPPAP